MRPRVPGLVAPAATMRTHTKQKWSAAFIGGGLVLGLAGLWLGLDHVFDGWGDPAYERSRTIGSGYNAYVQAAIALLVIAGVAMLVGLAIAAVAFARRSRAERFDRFTSVMLAGVAAIAVSTLVSMALLGPTEDLWAAVFVVGSAVGSLATLVGAAGVLVRPTPGVDGFVATAPSTV